ncbi:alginate O-acetylation protein [Oscillospiraceae bacterium]|nr:alginate O-acetylation protein [Oscillospiraceae bacterium]BDF74462.1 alginate O-acetylation protein [Oscillospiraceae bacterium]
MSVAFYAYGERKFVYIMLGMTLVDYVAAILIEHTIEKVRKLILVGTISLNLLILFIFKYLDFTIAQINAVFNAQLPLQNIVLPIGISFFTFQSMSYVIDVYRGQGKAQKNPIAVVQYISLFPQLIAGPIVRYLDVEHELNHRKENLNDFANGCARFIIGLGKKVLFSNAFAIVADTAFDALAAGNSISVLAAWMGAIGYTLQIYFDFSGYSDMAIGLGWMFGFHFLENFNYPYISKSITEFWRRWHISLGSWFRDYVYIPLGGSRVPVRRRNLNLAIVWLLTGIWHGANWTFIAWGMMYFVLLLLEKNTHILKFLGKGSRIYTMLFVMLGWVIFRSTSLTMAIQYIGTMFGWRAAGFSDMMSDYFLNNYGLLIFVGCIASTPVFTHLSTTKTKWGKRIVKTCHIIFMVMVLIISTSYLVKGSYNPFIYFNF